MAIAIFGSVVDLDRQARQFLDQELPHQRRVPRRAARQHDHAVDFGERLRIDVQFFEKDPAGLGGRAPEHRFAHGPGLLVDLLEHEVLVSGLLGHDRIPGDVLRLLRHFLAGEIREAHPCPRDDRHLQIVEKHHIARVTQNRRDIGRDKELSLADAHDHRRAVSDRHNRVGIVRADEHDREQPAKPLERAADRRDQPVAAALLLDQVRDDFRVGFRDERVAGPAISSRLSSR